MNDSTSAKTEFRGDLVRPLRLALAILAAGVALLTMAGSLFGSPAMAALGSGLVPMAPLGAVEVVLLAATSLFLERRAAFGAARRLACLLAGGVAALSLALALGHSQGGTLAFERWLLRSRPQFQLTSLLTDLALLGAGLSLLWRDWRTVMPWRDRQSAALLALIPLGIGGLVLIGYVMGAPLFYGSGRIPMALPTACCALALGLSFLLAAGPDTWPAAILRGESGQARTWSMLGLRRRTWTLVLLLAVMVVVCGTFYMRRQLREAQGRIQGELTTIAALKARQIEAWQDERRGDAQQIAHGPLLQTQLRRFLAGSAQAPPEADLRAWMAQYQGLYSEVILFDSQGRTRMAVPAQAPVPAAAEVQLALQAPDVLIQDLHLLPGQSQIRMSLWVPIGAGIPGRAAEGALLLQVDPAAFLYPLVQSWPTASPSAETLLVRREGDAVLFLNDLRNRANTALKLRLPLTSVVGVPAARAALGAEGLMAGADYRGNPVIAVLRPVPGTDWHMVTKVDLAEIYGPLRQRVWGETLGLAGLLCLAAAVLGLLLKHHDAGMVQKQLHLAQRFEWLMREANDIILLLDGEGRIQEANARAEEAYGYGLPELLGMHVLELRTRESQEEGRDQYERLKEPGSHRFETINQRKDGTTFPVEISSRALVLEGELRLINVVRDITERRAQEQEILRMTRLYSALSQVNQSIVWSSTREDLFKRICEAMVDFGLFSMAWIGLDDPATHRVTVAASCGDALGMLERIAVRSDDSPEGSGALGMAIRQGSPCINNDFLNSPESAHWREELAASGCVSSAALPIRLGGEVIGALAVYSREKDFFGTHEAALLVEAAMDISFALDHLAGEDQRRAAEAALLESDRLLLEAQEAGGIGTYTWFIREDRWTCSPFLDRIFGIGPDYPRTLVGWTELVAPEFREGMQAYVAGIIERHEQFDLDYPITRQSDGAARWVHGRGDIQRDAEEHPIAMVGIIQDITERKTAERSLRKISVAVEQSPLAIMITDPRGIIEYVNPAFTGVTGYPAGEAIGRNPRFLKSPLTRKEDYRRMWEILARGEVWVGEFQNIRKNGEVFHERATIAPVREDGGQLVGYIAIKDDITQFKKDEEKRHSLEAQLHQSQKMESLGSLAGGVAHDMNNVLGAILGLASTLREKAEPATMDRKSLDTIVNACLRGRGVVKSLLYFAKKDLQEERPIDLNDIAREIHQLLSHTMLKRIEVELDLDEEIGLVRGDAGALSHALMNLCVNATDAMAAGGTLDIRTRGDGAGGVVLTVRDTGEGMLPDVLAKAMEPFFTTKPLGKGTGLGLSMVYGTMMAHDGSFDLFSQPGQGTEATLRFPASRVMPRVPAREMTPMVAFAAHGVLRILLVDDDELIREAVGPLLEMLGHTVVAAASGSQALGLLKSGLLVDLVILDMNMPGMNGAEALPRILSLRPGVPVIMATGYSDQEIAPLMREHPTVTSLRKPFTLKEIQSKINGLQIQPPLDFEKDPSA